jgi:hypothetical protein
MLGSQAYLHRVSKEFNLLISLSSMTKSNSMFSLMWMGSSDLGKTPKKKKGIQILK